MTDWFSLSLLCAFALASADALTKKYLPNYSAWELLLIRFSVPGLLLLPMLFVYPLPDVPMAFWGWLALIIPLEVIAMLLYMQAIRDAPLYETLPYLAFTPVFNIVTGWLVLGEEVSLLGAAGIFLVVVGAYLLNIHQLRRNGQQFWLEPLRAIVHQQGSRRMLMVAIIYSVTSVVGKAAMQYVGPTSFGAFYYVVIGSVTLVLIVIMRPKSFRVLKHNPIQHLLIGSLLALMVVSHFLAISLVEAAYMIAVKRTSLLFGIIYGAILFQESGLAKHLASASIMLLGVALILLA